VNAAAQPVEIPKKDLIDRIADALPVEVRADYYRELRHCRSLPENDEMLRILRAMQFLTLLIHDAPTRLGTERQALGENLSKCIAALQAIEQRLDALPEDLASNIQPERVAARLNEALRQQFVQTTIPETGQALTASAAQLKRSVGEFVAAAKEISGQHQSTAREAREAVAQIHSAIQAATQASREATADLTRTTQYLTWNGLVIGACGLYFMGLLTGFLWFR
jgi:predicted  nucleic acid-binding Zn-ribbon protein